MNSIIARILSLLLSRHAPTHSPLPMIANGDLASPSQSPSPSEPYISPSHEPERDLSHPGRTVIVRFWRLASWPYSIDELTAEQQSMAQIRTIEVPWSETYVRDGKRYYEMVVGYRESRELLVEADAKTYDPV